MRKPHIPRTMTYEGLLEAALEVVDAVGIESLTIRSVATAARVSPLALYSHFVRKEQLLELLTEGVGAMLVDDIAHDTWQRELAHICQNVRCMLIASPRRLPLLSRWVASLPRPELGRLLAFMVANGMSERRAVRTISEAGILALNLAARELSAQPQRRYEAARSSGTWARDEGFELAVRRYLAGMR